jgi:hypothetical protein
MGSKTTSFMPRARASAASRAVIMASGEPCLCWRQK